MQLECLSLCHKLFAVVLLRGSGSLDCIFNNEVGQIWIDISARCQQNSLASIYIVKQSRLKTGTSK